MAHDLKDLAVQWLKAERDQRCAEQRQEQAANDYEAARLKAREAESQILEALKAGGEYDAVVVLERTAVVMKRYGGGPCDVRRVNVVP